MKRLIAIELISLLYIILFLYTGISKLMEYSVFKEQISTSSLIGPFLQNIALLIPWIELIVAIALFIPRWRLKGLYTSLILMIGFTVYIIAILSFSKTIPCSCGGVMEELTWTDHIILNGIFIALAVIAIILKKHSNIEAKRSAMLTNVLN